METLNTILMIALAVLVVVVLIKVLTAPIRFIFKLLLNTVIGFVILFAVNIVGQYLGFQLELNLFNALITGVFGIPGVIFLVILNVWL